MTPYDPEFYRWQRVGSRASAAIVLPRLLEWVRPSSVVDVGCGVGTWLGEVRRLGVDDILGVDGAYVDRSMLEIPPDRFVARDLTGPLNLARTFDLVMSLEVAEHLPASSAENFVKALTELGPVVLFSAAIPGQGGEGHVNEEWPQAWAERFARHGYRWADPLRALLWNDVRVDAWYAQNLLVFLRSDAFVTAPWATAPWAATPSMPWPLPLVHPTFFRRLVNREPTVHRAWKEFRRAIGATFRRRKPG